MKTFEHPLIFINYRISVSNNAVNLLESNLSARYGATAVFRDKRDIETGEGWEERLNKSLKHCQLLLIVLNEGWIECAYKETNKQYGEVKGQRRLDNSNDWVRKEIEYSFQNNKKVLPLRFDGVKPYPKDDYPENYHENYPAEHKLSHLATLQQSLEVDSSKNNTPQFNQIYEWIEKHIPDIKPTKQETPKEEVVKNNFINLLQDHYPLPDNLQHNPPQSQSPYMDLTWFKAKDARIFFGRSEETYMVCQTIQTSSARVLLLHGLSGVGKSSLLDAGVKPRLEEKGWQVCHARRNDDPINGLPSVLKILEKEAKIPSKRSLFIIDQIEEAITNPLAEAGELESFCKSLHTLLQSSPNAKFILCFRKEFLAEIGKALEESSVYTLVKTSGVEHQFLVPLHQEGILEAIQGAWLDDNLRKNHFRDFSFQPKNLPEQIAADIARDGASNVAPLLSVQMLDLWKEAALQNSNKPILSEALYQKTRYGTLENFLETQFAKFPEKI
jgi:hypothetical protein